MIARSISILLACGLLSACGAEKRTTGPGQPQTAPTGPGDPRVALIEASFDQISQGGRYFSWYGCGSCHAQGAPGARELGDPNWSHGGGFDQIYRSIADHPGISPAYGARIPTEQLWQLAAYVRSLPSLAPDRRRRQDFDQKSEAQADTWPGPVR